MSVLLVVLGVLAGAAIVAGLWVASAARSRGAARNEVQSRSEPGDTPPTLDTQPATGSVDLTLLRAALDALDVGVVYADVSGEIVLRNRAAEHASGIRHGDVLVDEAVERLTRRALLGEDCGRTVSLIGPPARVFDVRARPVAGGGALVTITDTTERTRLDAVRTDFVANISHELKTPVGAMSILAETLADAEDPEVVRRLAGKIVSEADRLTQAIEDLLELALVEMSGDLRREEVQAADIVRAAADRVQGFADRRRVSIVVREPEAPVRLMANRVEMVSAMANLIDNAVKYSDEGTTVEVTVTRLGNEVAFRVKDQGMGIAPQHHERIFERFYRVDKARSRDTGGVGHGLAIVRHVAINHGGEVNVTSQEGEGSSFTLVLPLSRGSQ